MPFTCPYCHRNFRTRQAHFWCLTEPELQNLIKQNLKEMQKTMPEAGEIVYRDRMWHKQDVVIDIPTDCHSSKPFHRRSDTWAVYVHDWCESCWR